MTALRLTHVLTSVELDRRRRRGPLLSALFVVTGFLATMAAAAATMAAVAAIGMAVMA